MDAYEQSFWHGLKPDPILTVSEWSDEHRILSSKSSAESGQWRTSRTPFLKEIMDCLSVTSPVEEVDFMKAAQIGGTECGNNWIGYIIDHAPGPTMIVQPTVTMAERNSKQRIAPLIEESPRLSKKVKDPRSRDSGNTVLMKEFTGGLLVMTGANSGTGLRSLPAKNLFLDEVDAYPMDVDGEGSPVQLAKKRTSTFSKRKIFKVSTPTIEETSNIAKSYENSDQRKYFVPCPHCGEMDFLKWPQVKWEKGKELDAWYECEHCNGKIENWQKTTMLKHGEWRPTNPDWKNPKKRGYHLSSLYSPVGWLSWGELAVEWTEAQGNREKLKTFINTALGETWKDKGDAPDWKRLHERRELYERNSIPEGALFLTAGCDVQQDRLEVEIVGWGRKKESWSIDYRVFMGDTSTEDKPVWKELEALVHETWAVGKVDMPISIMGVDSGYNSQTVYSWCRKFPKGKVIPTKGSDTASVIVGQPKPVDVTTRGKKITRGIQLFTIGVSIAKQELYGWLKQDTPDEGEDFPYGWCHFPEYGEDYFKMLTAEELQIKWIKAKKKYEWTKIRDRNEALDCRVIARCCAALKGLDRFKEQHWTKMENEIGVRQKVTKTQNNVTLESEKPQKRVLKRRKSTFL